MEKYIKREDECYKGVRLHKDTKKKLDEIAEKNNTRAGTIIRNLIERYVLEEDNAKDS